MLIGCVGFETTFAMVDAVLVLCAGGCCAPPIGGPSILAAAPLHDALVRRKAIVEIRLTRMYLVRSTLRLSDGGVASAADRKPSRLARRRIRQHRFHGSLQLSCDLLTTHLADASPPKLLPARSLDDASLRPRPVAGAAGSACPFRRDFELWPNRAAEANPRGFDDK